MHRRGGDGGVGVVRDCLAGAWISGGDCGSRSRGMPVLLGRAVEAARGADVSDPGPASRSGAGVSRALRSAQRLVGQRVGLSNAMDAANGAERTLVYASPEMMGEQPNAGKVCGAPPAEFRSPYPRIKKSPLLFRVSYGGAATLSEGPAGLPTELCSMPDSFFKPRTPPFSGVRKFTSWRRELRFPLLPARRRRHSECVVRRRTVHGHW